jgi:hypothetical protein
MMGGLQSLNRVPLLGDVLFHFDNVPIGLRKVSKFLIAVHVGSHWELRPSRSNVLQIGRKVQTEPLPRFLGRVLPPPARNEQRKVTVRCG